MNIEHPVQLKIKLRPIWHIDPPEVDIGVNGNIQRVVLDTEQTFCYEFNSATKSTITIELLNKTNQDTVLDKGLDKAVVIESVSFFEISDPKFTWLGVYEPCYPEPWATEQTEQGVVLKQHLTNQTYLSWNGKWSLTFTVPVFTWIHNVQNLGWIYG
jgi:hypothetical protein